MNNSLFLKIFISAFYSMTFVIFSGCSRPENENSKIQIQFPESVQQNKSMAPTYMGKLLQSTSNVSTYATPLAITPTGFSGDNPINCYIVLVSGPEQFLRQNICGRKNDPSFGTRQVGPWSGGIPAGGKLELDVPAGLDRVVMLAGFYAQNGACKDFKQLGFDETNLTRPYFLGEKGKLELKAGATQTVSINMSFDSNKWFDGCQGPDFQNNGPGDQNNNNMPYMRFENLGQWNSATMKNMATTNECYSTKAMLFQNSSAFINPNTAAINIDLSNNSIGAFYSDSACTSSQIFATSIPVDSSSSATIYYKPTSSGIDQKIPAVITNSSVTINYDQKFDFGGPKLIVYGPDKVVPNVCLAYKVRREKFEGGSYAPVASATLTLSDNANYYLRGGSDCSSGTTGFIATSIDNTTVYFKMMTPSPIDVGSVITSAGYQSTSYTVTNADSSSNPAAVQFISTKNPLERGQCQPAIVRLVNWDGGALATKIPFDINLKIPKGAGLFYDNQYCNGSIIDTVSFAPNDSEKVVYLRMFGPTASIIPIHIDGAYRLHGLMAGAESKIDFALVNPTDPWYLIVQPPNFNGAEIVGTQEFDDDSGNPYTFKKIPIFYNTDTTHQTAVIQCSNDGSTWNPCTAAELDTSGNPIFYKWYMGDAVNENSKWIRAYYSGNNGNNGDRSVLIKPTQLYGNNFKVYNCNSTAGTGAGQTIGGVSSSHGGSTTLCFPANTTYTRSSAGEVFNMVTVGNHRLIGHSSGTTVLDGSAQSAAIINFGSALSLSNSTDPGVVANFSIIGVETDGLSSNGAICTSAGCTFEINNINIISGNTGANKTLINLTLNNANLAFKLGKINARVESAGTSKALSITNHSSGVKVRDSNFEVLSTGAYGVYYVAGGNSIAYGEFRNLNIASSAGTAMKLAGSPSSPLTGTLIENSNFKRMGAGSGETLVYSYGKVLGNYRFNRFVSDVGSQNPALLNFFQDSTYGNFVGSLTANTFVQGYTNSPALKFDSTTAGTNTFSDLTNNSFGYIGAGTTAAAFSVNSNDNINASSNSTAASGDNLVCSLTAAQWANTFTMTGGGSWINPGTLQFNTGLINTATNIDGNSGRCK